VKFLTTAAKAAFIIAGVGFGVLRGLRLLDGLTDPTPELSAIRERLEGIQLEITALQARDSQLQSKTEQAVTRDELSSALEKASVAIYSAVETRFEEQTRSVEALRAMVTETDELLERVLDRLEAMRNEAEANKIGV
jgi:predicted nuclease with TOPRIM domain